MGKIDLTKIKVKLNIVLWVLIIFLLFLLNQMSNNNRLKSDLSKYRKNHKKEIEQKIDTRDKIIKKLTTENRNYKNEIEEMMLKIDSLQRVKRKIQIKYVDRISNIKIMDSEQIKNYWHEEFN